MGFDWRVHAELDPVAHRGVWVYCNDEDCPRQHRCYHPSMGQALSSQGADALGHFSKAR